MVNVFLQFGILLGLAALLSLVARALKQPPLVAYLIAGVVTGPLFLNVLPSGELLDLFARFGVAFLLFIVGLHLNFKSLKEVGSVSTLVGVGTLAVVSGVSWGLARMLGFGSNVSLYLAAAFAFSSTVVVVKLLSDKREMDTLHGKITLGILIVEHFVAALMLMVVPVIGIASSSVLLIQLGKALALIAATVITGLVILPPLFSFAARWSESLFLASTAWVLLVAAAFHALHFSFEIGALLAGITLASSRYALDISTRMRTLRDFFVVLFFVYFGSLLVGPFTVDLWVAAGLFSILILVGKPLVVMSFMRFFKYKKRTNFFTGVGLAQISEFSLILLLVGFSQGVISQAVLSLGIIVAFITLTFSSYTLLHSHALFSALSPVLSLFESRSFTVDDLRTSKKYHTILFGYNRIGFTLVRALQKARVSFLVVDYNPQTILELSKRGVPCVYGDAQDPDLLEELRLDEASVVISTIPDVSTNHLIYSAIKSKDTLFMPTSHSALHTEELYATGADYVIMPYFLGGSYVGDLLTETLTKEKLSEERAKQQRELKERTKEGQTHPTRESYGR